MRSKGSSPSISQSSVAPVYLRLPNTDSGTSDLGMILGLYGIIFTPSFLQVVVSGESLKGLMGENSSDRKAMDKTKKYQHVSKVDPSFSRVPSLLSPFSLPSKSSARRSSPSEDCGILRLILHVQSKNTLNIKESAVVARRDHALTKYDLFVGTA